MRVVQQTVTYYTLPELKEHDANAYEKALDTIRTSMWDGGWPKDDVSETIVYEFGSRVGDSTVARYGEGDYPGIAGVKLKSWAVQDRSAHVGFDGTIYPDDAPGLPWDEETGWIDSVTLRAGRSYTEVVINDGDEAPYIGYTTRKDQYTTEQQRLVDLRDAMKDAVDEALSESLAAGEKQAEFLESEENLLELAKDNEWEFDENGAWA